MACLHSGANIVHFLFHLDMFFLLIFCYCPFSVPFRYVFYSYFLSSIEPVTPDLSTILYVVFLHSNVDVGFILYMIFNNFPTMHTFNDVLQMSLPYLFEFKMRFFPLNLAFKYLTSS